tara:strand:- start:243 stop:2690 length:2448 start_codon:yes stop_codon:yes gene_type:complete
MKVSQNWLKELVEINTTPEILSEKLSIGGFEVESLLDISTKFKGVILGRVLSAEKHENSNKLSVCNVDIGDKNLQIICGAKNIRKDIFVYVATVGTYLEKINLKIKISEIRGISSEGMICSLEELGLEEKSDGIAILDETIIDRYKLGTSFVEINNFNDIIYDLAITANRPDGMSMIGIAREVSALLKSNLKLPETNTNFDYEIFTTKNLCEEAIKSDCIYTLTEINNVNGKLLSPDWMKDRLEKSDIKSINLIVDITNYILLEQGQPLHAFDKEKLNSLVGKEVNPNDFGVRKAVAGEKFLALDENIYDLNNRITVITCANRPIAIAGVIGGMETAVSDTTSSIIVEAAVFNPLTIRKSSKEIGIRTEASNRFEKGISSKNTLKALSRTFALFINSFEIETQKVFINNIQKQEDKLIRLRRSRINMILGPIIEKSSEKLIKRKISDDEIEDKLKLIGCTLNNKDYGWDVKVIPNRSQDLMREIDLIEEIARLIGYDSFDQNIPKPLIPGKLNKFQLATNKIKDSFISSGFNEVLTYSLVSNKDNSRIKISNPLLVETSCLRNNLYEDHIKICDQNIKAGRNCCWIFEIGKLYYQNSSYMEEEVISGIIYGNNRFEKWDTSGKNKNLNYYEARGKLREALDSLKISITDITTDKYDFLHPGRSALLLIEGQESGYFGQIHPKFSIENKGLANVYIFTLKLKKLQESATRNKKWIPIYKDYPTVPKIERDINFIFNKKYLISEIFNTIKKVGKDLLKEVTLIDIYEDSLLGEDNISYTMRLSYRDSKKTLKESDISEIHRKIINQIEIKYHTKLRE